MADTNDFNDLPTGIPVEADVLAVQQPGGVMFKSPISALRNDFNALAEVHSNTDYTHNDVTTTPIPLEGYDASLVAMGVTVILNPVSNGANNSNEAKFVVNSGKDGNYRVTFNIDVESLTTTENVDFTLYHTPLSTGIAVPTEFKASVDMRNPAIDRGTASINTFFGVVEGDELEMYINSDGDTFSDLLIDSLTFTVERK